MNKLFLVCYFLEKMSGFSGSSGRKAFVRSESAGKKICNDESYGRPKLIV